MTCEQALETLASLLAQCGASRQLAVLVLGTTAQRIGWTRERLAEPVTVEFLDRVQVSLRESVEVGRVTGEEWPGWIADSMAELRRGLGL